MPVWQCATGRPAGGDHVAGDDLLPAVSTPPSISAPQNPDQPGAIGDPDRRESLELLLGRGREDEAVLSSEAPAAAARKYMGLSQASICVPA